MLDNTTASAYDFEDVGSVPVTGGGADWFSSSPKVERTTGVHYLHEIDSSDDLDYFVADEDFIDSNLDAVEKKCNDRLILLAQSYGEKINPSYKRDLVARIEILEQTIEATFPRYDVGDWSLLEKFSNSILKLQGSS